MAMHPLIREVDEIGESAIISMRRLFGFSLTMSIIIIIIKFFTQKSS